MITNAITLATDEVPKLYEAGWDWWAWPIAWLAFLACGLFMGTAAPLFVFFGEGLTGVWRGLVCAAVVVAGLAAVVFGWMGSGILMRHHQDAGTAGWTFFGALIVAGVSWYWSNRAMDSTRADWSYNPGMAWYTAAPAIVITAGAVVNGISEIITRLAASIPMPVATFLGIAALGALVLGLSATKRNSY